MLERAVLIFLLAIAPASAQVINGEGTYGDSDLHQPPDDGAARTDPTTRDDRRPRDAPATERR